MNTITIPRKLAQRDDLIVIPRKEYEALLNLKQLKEFEPTPAQRKLLLKAERDLDKNKNISPIFSNTGKMLKYLHSK